VVQYGQQEMQAPGILPYPVTLARTAARVTDEQAPVRVIDPGSRLLTTPNRIGATDFEGWVQERAVYMPSSFDPHYRAPLEMHDPGEPENQGAVLVAPLTASVMSSVDQTDEGLASGVNNAASRIAQLTVIDCLFIGVAQQHMDAAVNALDATRDAVGSHRLGVRPDGRRRPRETGK